MFGSSQVLFSTLTTVASRLSYVLLPRLIVDAPLGPCAVPRKLLSCLPLRFTGCQMHRLLMLLTPVWLISLKMTCLMSMGHGLMPCVRPRNSLLAFVWRRLAHNGNSIMLRTSLLSVANGRPLLPLGSRVAPRPSSVLCAPPVNGKLRPR